MARRLWLTIGLAVLCAIPSASMNAQNGAPNAQSVLAAANVAMGGDKLKSLQYSATGYVGALGQAIVAPVNTSNGPTTSSAWMP